jgi:hypothetical protein
MMDDAVAMTLASTGAVAAEEIEIDMQPAEEENDDDTPMREDVPEEVQEEVTEDVNDINTELGPGVGSAPVSEPASWPPAPTDVPPVPSLLPSALAVPQEAQHEEGKVHEGAISTSRPASVVAEPAAVPADPSLEPTTAQLVAPADGEETRSNAVEPAASVRGSDIGTVNEDYIGTATAATSVNGGDAGKDEEKWPPAPTEVPAVPSMLPSVLAVPDASVDKAGAVAAESGRGEEASVVAEPAGSVRAEDASRDIDGGVDGAVNGDDAGGVSTNGVEKEVSGDVDGQDAREEELAETVQGESETVAGGSIATDINTPQSQKMPIVLVISNVRHQPLFATLPSDVEYESDEPVGPPILAGMAVDLYETALSEIFQGLRDALAHSDDAFSIKRGKELVLEQQELSLRVGEVSLRGMCLSHSLFVFRAPSG